MRAFAVAISAAALAVVTFPAFATTLHVCPDGSGDYATIQAAVDAAASGDTVELCDGLFEGAGNLDIDFGTKELALRSLNGHEATILDGGFFCKTADAHRAFLIAGGQTRATSIEGVTLQHFQVAGGVIRCDGTSPVLRDVHFRFSFATLGSPPPYEGRDLVVRGGSPLIQDCLFQNDGCFSTRFTRGVAIYARESSPTIERCLFRLTANLGAVDLDGGMVVDCTFRDISGVEGPGMCLRVTGEVTVTGTQFVSSFAQGIISSGNLLVSDCLFEENVADSESGLGCHGTTRIENSTFRNNYGQFSASAILWSGVLSLDHCLFIGNRTGGSSWGATVTGYGSGDLEVSHCTFAGNDSYGSPGAVLRLDDGTSAAIDHTIVAFGTHYSAVTCVGPPAAIEVTCSDFYGNGLGDWVGCVAGLLGAGGNLSADPLFCDATSDNLALHSASPCAPAHSGTCGLIGALGIACGPTAVQSSSWGSIKALFR